jgi:drug/metabolite transporter (DMT)-like permease/rhodanese-related sulfurtransferase
MSYMRGLLLVLGAGVLWSTQGLAVHLIDSADAWQILFYRSIAVSILLIGIIGSKYRAATITACLKISWPGVLGATCLAIAYAAGILAMQRIEIANAVLLFATAPFFGAILGWLALSEKVSGPSWIAIAFAMIGILVMQSGAFAEGSAFCSLLTILSALGFALFTITLRWKRSDDMMPTILLSGLIVMVICIVVATGKGTGLVVSAHDAIIALVMGVFQTGAGLVLYTIGARAVPAAQLTFLPLIEVFLSPLCVAIFIGEIPRIMTVIGGFLVTLAITSDAAFSVLRSRKHPNPDPPQRTNQMPYIRRLRTTLFALLTLLITPTITLAETQIMPAPEAYSAALNDDLIILDIRSPGEWAETGIAQGAWPVTMHDPNFGTNLQKIITSFPNKRLALICATGGRTEYVASILTKNGMPNVIDISEGMFGNGKAPGWIARKLPIVDEKTARAAYTAALLKKN